MKEAERKNTTGKQVYSSEYVLYCRSDYNSADTNHELANTYISKFWLDISLMSFYRSNDMKTVRS
jgi:hypothetical protein